MKRQAKREPNAIALSTIKRLLQRAEDELTSDKRRQCLKSAHVILGRLVGKD